MNTVGILYPGEMGSSLGRLISEAGFQVVTTLEYRSARTRQLCVEAGLKPLASFEDVIRVSDFVISVVPPASALQLAQRYYGLACADSRSQVYIDANSISPATAEQISSLVSGCGKKFVDAAIHGLASRLREQGTLYLSGEAAAQVAQLFADRIKIKLLGDAPGKASALKMMMGGMSKGLVALFIEMSLAARKADLLDELIAGCDQYYPGVMEAIERLVPTYPRHAARRGEEMRELEQTLLSLGLRPQMVSGARSSIAAIGELNLAERHAQKDRWSVKDVIEAIATRASVED